MLEIQYYTSPGAGDMYKKLWLYKYGIMMQIYFLGLHNKL